MGLKVLGIDPGLTRCGVGVIEVSQSRIVKLLSIEVIQSEPKIDISSRVGTIAKRLEQIFSEAEPDSVAIERVYADSNVSTVMGTAHISGVAMFLAHQRGIPVTLHTPTEVKAAVTGSGRATKGQVGRMVASILGLPEIPKPADAADALAIAICHAWRALSTLESSSNLAVTPAQRAWRAAEAAAKHSTKAN